MENNFTEGECRTYENLDALRMQVDSTDSASLHFETILENATEQAQNASTTNGFPFDKKPDAPTAQQKLVPDPSANYENDDVAREKVDYPPKCVSFGGAIPKNELIDNVLFIKFRQAADTTAITSPSRATGINAEAGEPSGTTKSDANDDLREGKLEDSNSVSCEDLLEFADSKPKGKDRGVESDEVRLMTKVLGTTVRKSFVHLLAIHFEKPFP